MPIAPQYLQNQQSFQGQGGYQGYQGQQQQGGQGNGGYQGYGNQVGAFTTPGFQPYQEQNWFDKFLYGTPEYTQQFPKYNQQGYGALSALLSSGQNQLQNPYQGFEPLRQETMNDYYQNIIPGISNQFTANTNGRPSSPQFGSQLGQGASQLGALLNAQRARFGQQNQQNAVQQLQLGLKEPFDYMQRPSTPGFFENTYNNINQAGQTAAKYLPLLL